MDNNKAWEEFIINLAKISNIDLKNYKRPQMERRISSFMRQQGVENYKEFLSLLTANKDVYQKFIEHLTINVSEFFRNAGHWKVLAEEIFPELAKRRGGPLKIWSAGCSTGEEPYSLAMVAKEKNVKIENKILATDLDREVLAKAVKGTYSEKEIEGVPPPLKKKYFKQDGNFYTINDEIKNMIKFTRQNLLRDSFDKNFDLILCRNVVIYFTEETKKTLYKKFVEALRPNGIIFVGSTEQIFNSREIGLHTQKIFFYTKQ
ncbi:MAG: protein-glutamate O-methyltransferase CheR [Syntrophomonadaceae bacterium]|jgi:chemotaxis protein methyltransferase CheR|nr:protein-glutamate O-methyltransferase CheR [Syntrophomonadaceae bacterium]